jgi:hypothetical protein
MRILKESGFSDSQIEAFLSTLGFNDRTTQAGATVRSATSTQQGATK